MGWIKSFLATFHPVRDAYYVSIMLQYRKFPYQKIYEDIVESPERQFQLFENLFNPTNENNNHETFFGLRKLQRNPILAKKIFLETEPVVYKGRLFVPGLDFISGNAYWKDGNLVMAMLRFVIKEQMSMARGLVWLDRFLKIAREHHVREIFKLLFDRREMTPRIIESFIEHRRDEKERKSLISHIYPDPTLPRDELLMRCALLLNIVPLRDIYIKCLGFDLQDSLDELQKIALDRGDRQSISILFHWKCPRRQEKRPEASEMLEYVELGKLSPLTTARFVGLRSATIKDEFSDWPPEHLRDYLPLAFLQVPKEDRLSEWLCSNDLMYDEVITSLDNLYDKHPKMPINMRFTEPVRMKNGRVITRAANAIILNAQTILNAYRSDQQAQKKIPIEDYQKIMVGIPYALAEGQHLDFSNTELEMPEGNKEWDRLKYFSYHHQQTTAFQVLRYLKSGEVYDYVHRAEVRQSIQDRQVEEIIEGTAGLFIT